MRITKFKRACALFLLCACLVNVVYAGDTGSKAEATAAETITMGEMQRLFSDNGLKPIVLLPENRDRTATVTDFLTAFSAAYGGRFIYYDGLNFHYLCGDSMFLSEKEWQSLMDRQTFPVSRDEAASIVKRAENAADYMKIRYIADTDIRFREIVSAFYKDLEPLVQENSEATAYWLDKSMSELSYNFRLFPSIFHELGHELGSRRSGVYLGRFTADDAWGVRFQKRPAVAHYYILPDKAWLGVKTIHTPEARSVLGRTVPANVRSTNLYRFYMQAEKAANDYGYYGLLDEFLLP